METTKKHLFQNIIVLILISSNKIVMNLSYKNQISWLVNIIIGNLDAKTRQSQKQLKILFLGFIQIILKQLEDTNNKDKNLKVKIYHITLKFILWHIYLSLFFVDFGKKRC